MKISDRDVRRFWNRVTKRDADDCWLWTGSSTPDGYGRMSFGGRSNQRVYRAHRLSYFLANGAFTESLSVCHTCDNPPCVNPAHLWLGTMGDNLRDMWRKGRARPGHSPGERNGSAKISRDTALAVRDADGTSREIAARFGISASQVSNIRRGDSWSHAGGQRTSRLSAFESKAAAGHSVCKICGVRLRSVVTMR